MPKGAEKQYKALLKKGYSKGSAYRIASASLKKKAKKRGK